MTVLLTNDDGISSPGLDALRSAFSVDHDVWIVAPDGERSGYSNSITIRDPIRCQAVGERLFAISGTPADCVILGTRGAIPVEPDIVISGVNIGPNLGSDIIYSGTCAAARQAAYREIPAIAVSLNSFRPPFHFEPVVDFLVKNLEELIGLWDSDHFININAPNRPDPVAVDITTPSMRRYDDRLLPCESPRGDIWYFVQGSPSQTVLEEGTDWYSVERGAISVSPIMLNPINHDVEHHYLASSFVAQR